MPAQMPTALLRSDFGKAAVNRDSVAGMMNAAPIPATARATMIWRGLSKNTRGDRSEREDAQPGKDCAAPAVPIADRAGRQQQAGQHQGVPVDHPGELPLSRIGLQRDIE